MQLSLSATTVLNPNEQARTSLSEVVKMLGAERGLLFLLNENTGELELKFRCDKDGKNIVAEVRVSQSVLEMVMHRKSALVLTGDEEGTPVKSESIVKHQLKSILAAPLLIGEKCLGVLYLDNHLAKGVFTKEDVEILQAIGSQLVFSIEMANLAKAELDKRALEKDLEVIGAIQTLLLPKNKEVSNSEWELASYYQPASMSGGDWWWYQEGRDSEVVVVMGDVTGHGAGAAMVTALVAASFRSLFADKPYFETSPQAMTDRLVSLHHMLREYCSGNYWMTLTAVALNNQKKQIRVWNLGGPPVFKINLENRETTSLMPRGMPLGSEETLVGYEEEFYKERTRYVLLTDGVYEMVLPNKKELGWRGFTKLIKETSDRRTDMARQEIAEKLSNLRKNEPLKDDLAFIVLTPKSK